MAFELVSILILILVINYYVFGFNRKHFCAWLRFEEHLAESETLIRVIVLRRCVLDIWGYIF